MPRYYRDDSREITEFVAWSMVITGLGLRALWEAIRPRPDMYYPKAPDDPTQVPVVERFLKGNTIDLTKAKLPKLDLSGLKSLKDLKEVKVEWKAEDRPQLVKAEENPYPFLLPVSRDGATVVRVFPTATEVNHQTAVAFMTTLLASCPHLSLEIGAARGGIYWQLVDLEGQYPAEVIAMHIKSHYPDAAVEVSVASPEARTYPFHRQLVVFGLSNDYAAPLPFHSLAKVSHLVTLVNRMALLSPDHEERMVYRLVTYTRSAEAEHRAGRRLSEGMVKPTSGLWRQTDPFLGMDDKLLNAKLDLPQYHAFLSLTVESRDEKRLPILIQSAHDLTSIAQPRHNALISIGNQPLKHRIETHEEAQLLWFETLLTALVRRRVDAWRKLLMVLSPEELATLWHLPDERFTAPTIGWKQASIAAGLTTASAQSVCIGDGEVGGQQRPVYTTPAERLTHTLVLGKTGTGKSTLLHSLIHQDIAAGRGVVVIDPQGALTHDILTFSIPTTRQHEVIHLDCGNDAIPVPLNPFRVPVGVSFAYANTYLYWLLRTIYASIWVEGRMDFTMKNVIQALLCDPEATPLDVARLFTDDAYRQHLLKRLPDHEEVALSVSQYWHQFHTKTRGERNELAQPIQNRTGAFVGNRALEQMTCHPHTLNFKEMLIGQQIVLISLAGERIQTEANNLGAIVLAHLYLASQSLGVLPKHAAPRSYVYVDEAHRFLTSPLPEMFSEARKYGLALTLATQYLSALGKDTQESIFGNVGTQYLFEVGLDDAKTLEKYVAPLTAEELLNVGKYRMLVKTRAEGRTQPAFLVRTRPVPEGDHPPCPEPSYPAEWGFMPKAEVAAWLKARYAPPPPSAETAAREVATGVSKTPKRPKAADTPEDSSVSEAKKTKPPAKKKPTDGLTDYE